MSSVPIALVAINVGGLRMGVEVLGLIVFIHALEAYVLNPRIVSAVMKLNPVITLMILYIAHSIMGVWGMLLGVPISVFFSSQIKIKTGKAGDENGNKNRNGDGDKNGLEKNHLEANGNEVSKENGAPAEIKTGD
jgi:predicted PurR-regulated permease PerM